MVYSVDFVWRKALGFCFYLKMTSVIKRVNLTSFPSMPLNFHKEMFSFNTIIPIDSLVFAMVVSC